MLPDTSERDRDQVVTRWVMRKLEQAKKEVVTASSRGIQVPKHNILMVDQLWLWWIPARNDGEADIVISSFPKREGVRVKGSRAVDDLQAAVLRSRNIHQRTVIEDTTALLARILTVCSSTLDRHQAIKNVEFLHMFQSSIGDAVSYARDVSHQVQLTIDRRKKRPVYSRNFVGLPRSYMIFTRTIRNIKN